jgi:hypothetical protein
VDVAALDGHVLVNADAVDGGSVLAVVRPVSRAAARAGESARRATGAADFGAAGAVSILALTTASVS